ncbi:MAG: sensor histidine kinase [Aquaticitalea sp.]
MIDNQLQNEPQRIQELKSFHILDTLSEKEYDDITTMASIICDAPIALISLVDSDRQWFKSHNGLAASETPREFSFCAHAIQIMDEPFIIPDSRIDERFKDNPLVTGDPNIVFYAGIPIVSKNGFGLGTVCIIDDKPRELTERQISALKILSDQVLNLLELHKANMELNVHNTSLESKLVQRVADNVLEIAKKNRALEKMNKELQSFTYISSHDLQEPLRKIQTFISMIADKEAENLSERGKEYFSKISQSSTRMRVLIQDLLAYSRSTNTKKEFKKVLISSILKDVQDDLLEEIETSEAVIKFDTDLEINVIPFQFRQLLYNLTSNSIRFSKPNQKPSIAIDATIASGDSFRVEALNSETSYCKITIKDNGIGFENKYHDKIFEVFQRLNSDRSIYGTGIGLAIVKKIVENHNGVILAKGQLNEGAIFEVYLPVN